MCGTALTMAGVVMGGDIAVNRAGRAARRKRPAA
jgi:hypothetical protein